jgi:hypothetical protein
MDEDKLDMVIERLDKLIFWLKFNNLEVAKEYFAKVLDTDRKREIYQLTDGRSIADISRAINVKSKSMVPNLLANWTAKGILIESPKIKGRKTKVIDLNELGL